MADLYLDIAERVLSMRGQPLTAQEILENAIRFNLIDSDRGATMHKTLQARITDDLQRLRYKSKFMRIGKGVYFLRKLETEQIEPFRNRSFIGRQRPNPDCRILHANHGSVRSLVERRTSTAQFLSNRDFEYHYLGKTRLLPVALLLFIYFGQEVLVHRVGKHSFYREIVGQDTPGFRSYIDEFDSDLFFSAERGLPVSTIRELLRNIDLPSVVAAQILMDHERSVQFGTSALDFQSRRVLITARINLSSFVDIKPNIVRRLDINSPRWILPSNFNPTPEGDFYRSIISELKLD